MILGTPFINLITPYRVNYDGITFKSKAEKLVFPFIEKPKTRNLNIIKACSIYDNEINNLIRGKEFQIENLKHNVSLHRIEKQLKDNLLQKRILEFQHKVEIEICADLPNAFWNRKQHMVDLPYEPDFNEKDIPTRARPIQMNAELEQHCRKEIQDLQDKGLITKSRSPWSCAAFYYSYLPEADSGFVML